MKKAKFYVILYEDKVWSKTAWTGMMPGSTKPKPAVTEDIAREALCLAIKNNPKAKYAILEEK